MKKARNSRLTLNQLMLMLVGFTLGPEFLRIPNVLVENAKQDAWIAAAAGLIYPIFIIIISSYIIKKYPKNNILEISRIFFGKIIGNILNFIFFTQYVIYTTTITVEVIRVLRIYVVAFLSPLKISIVIIGIAVYIATRGLRVLGQTNEFITYFLMGILITSIAAISTGNIKNVLPVFDSSMQNIITAATKTVYFYTGYEVITLLHPFVEDTKNIRKAGLGAVAIAGFIWVWTVFITVFYFGPDILPKAHWSFVFVFESVKLPLVNNFRYVFMFGYTLVAFRILANYLFASSFILNDFIKLDIKKICFFSSPIILFASMKLLQGVSKEMLLNTVSLPYVCFNIVFMFTLAALIWIKTRYTRNAKN